MKTAGVTWCDGICVWVSVQMGLKKRYNRLNSDGARSYTCARLMQVFVLTFMCVTCAGSMQQQDMKPKEKPIVKISSSGPAVLDSLVTFIATVTYPDGQIADKKLYKYEWSNSADTSWTGHTSDNDRSVINITFSRDFVRPGLYNMTVHVFKLRPGHIIPLEYIGNGQCIFELTAKINGKLMLYQESEKHDVPNDVFATGRDIVAAVTFTDSFLRTFSVTYKWTTESSGITERKITTLHPNITLSFNKTGVQFIGVHIKAHVLAENRCGDLKNITKVGAADEYATFIDPVNTLFFSGSRDYQPGTVLNGNFSCDGSPPVDFRVCFSLEDYGSSLNKSCQYSDTSNVCEFPVRYKLDQPGVYLMTGQASNVVSIKVHHVKVHVPETAPPESASVLIPLACVAIGLSVIITMLATYYRDKRKSNVETADFNFHTVHEGPAPWLQNLRHTLASFLSSRNNYDSGGVREYRPTTARHYGAFEHDVL